MTPAETTAAFLLARVRAGRPGTRGRGRVPTPALPSGPALQTFAERRVRGVPEAVVRGLFAWNRGERWISSSRSRVLALQVGASQRWSL